MAIYLKYEGVDGEATHQGHEKWIQISSFQFGFGRAIATPVGSAKNRESSAASVSEITVTKESDGASPKLFTEAASGSKGKKVEIHFVSTGDPGLTYAEYTLEDTLISGYSVSSGGERGQESLSLNFTKIQYKLTPYIDDNTAGTPITVSYDIATGKSG